MTISLARPVYGTVSDVNGNLATPSRTLKGHRDDGRRFSDPERRRRCT
jgi:hypothetical protein